MRKAVFASVLVCAALLAGGGCPLGGGELTNPRVTLSVDVTSLPEDEGVATVTATLSEPTGEDVIVQLAFGGTAESGKDYTRSRTNITIPAGQTTGTITIRGVADSGFDGDKTVTVAIASVTGGTEDGEQEVTVDIIDNDPEATVTLSRIGDFGNPEHRWPESMVDFDVPVTATLSHPVGQDVTVNLSFGGTATRDEDYTAPADQIVIPAGQLTGVLNLRAKQDDVYDDGEILIVSVESVTNAIEDTEDGEQEVRYEFQDDETAPTLTLALSGTSMSESGTAILTATLSEASGLTTTVTFDISGTATLDTDYSLTAEQIIIPKGQTVGTITIAGANDSLFEPDETVVFDVDEVTGADLQGARQFLLTITDNDGSARPTVTLSVDRTQIAENGGTVTITATQSVVSGVDTTVTLAFSGAATAGADFTTPSEQIVIPAGDLTGTLTLTAQDDAVYEGQEEVLVEIASVTHATEVGTQQESVVIVDDETLPTVTLELVDSPLDEAGGVAIVRVKLSNASFEEVTVDLALSGTATLDTDYTISRQQVKIAAGAIQGVAAITGIADSLNEGDETVVVDIDTVDKATENGTQQVTAVITDVTVPGVLLVEEGGATGVDETGATDTYTLVLATAPTADVTITVTPDAELDVGQGPGVAATLTFTPADWDQPQTVTVATADDFLIEGTETATITHTVASGDADYNGISVPDVTVEILDDDQAGVRIEQSDESTSVTEAGATDTYTLVLTAVPTADVVVVVTPNEQLDLGEGPGTAILVMFTPAHWDQPQAVTVAAVDDALPEGDHFGTITHSVASADTNFDEVPVDNVIVDIGDNDL